MIKSKLIGEWSKARTILNNRAQVLAAIDYAVQMEANQARRQIIKGITDQAPGGQQFLPLKPLTIASRRFRGFRGTKALIVTASLRNSITVRRSGPGRFFVGVLRTARTPDGKGLYNIARVQEEGAVVTMRMTERRWAWFMAMLRKNRMLGAKAPRFGTSRRRIPYNVVIRIPPRPYIRPVIEEIQSLPKLLQKRLAHRVAYRMKLALGKP